MSTVYDEVDILMCVCVCVGGGGGGLGSGVGGGGERERERVFTATKNVCFFTNAVLLPSEFDSACARTQ